ncbi:MAG TPA: FtsQ-type POTRA domain-containing protein [Thermoanaerobaculia bacterium]
MSYDTTASRFLRPPDVARLRRNQRRIQGQRLLVILRNLLVLALLAGAAVWGYRHTRSNERFAVRSIVVEGAVHSPQSEIERLTSRYEGMNLFQLDLERVQSDLDRVEWVKRIDIEKTLPGTLRIKITERTPVALLRTEDRLFYVDEEGLAFAELTPAAGNDDLPIISEAAGAELLRSIALLTQLQSSSPEIYSRISEVWPIAPRGFALFDRSVRAVVYANNDDLPQKYAQLDAILEAENRPRIEYADLRFNSRVIVKPHVTVKSGATDPTSARTAPEASPPLARHDGGEYVQN